MQNPCPCKQCLVYIMCKNRMKPFLYNQKSVQHIVLGFFNCLSPSCPKITKYIETEYKHYNEYYVRKKEQSIDNDIDLPMKYISRVIKATFLDEILK